ncbi:MAG: mannitol dehydrogenase family protein [Actinomycetota bacterium]
MPQYERGALSPRILHVGVGGFHRAHMAVYTDDVAATSGGGWGIRGVGLLDADRRMAETLRKQDTLYTVVERDTGVARPRVVGSIVDYALAARRPERFDELVADAGVEILSLTITEGGYSLAKPNPTIEAVVSALDARRNAGAAPLTILSCDNVPGNGDVARAAVVATAEQRSAELLGYVERSCTFPNSMVDRITPRTTDADRAWLRDAVGVDDDWPVVCEDFRQWVVQDRFAAGRPAWEEVGVLFTDRVHDWELYKLRLLNASHSCLAYLSALAGAVYVDEAMAIPAVRRYLDARIRTEAIPTLTEIPGHPATEYAAAALHRFENTGVRDQVARLCSDGAAKLRNFLVPTIESQLELGGPIELSTLTLAAWSRYLATVADGERAPDSAGEHVVALARASTAEPLAFLELDETFTPQLREHPRFRAVYEQSSRNLEAFGPLEAVELALRAAA